MDQEKIGNLFKERREAKNITQQELATILNVTDRAISNWEHGRRLPDYSLLAKLCDTLSISLDEIFILGKKAEKDIKQSTKETNELIDYYLSTHSHMELTGLNEEYSFNNFEIGDCNRDAFCRFYEIANGLISNRDHPLYIYGNKGTGKTHFVQWFGIYQKNEFNKKVLYVTSLQFIDDCYNVSQGHIRIQNFVDKYRNIDVLIIDDIQLIKGDKVIIELFHIMDYLLENKKLVIFTGDKRFSELNLDDQIKEKIDVVFQVSLKPLDYETRIKILKKLIEGFPKLEVKWTVENYIAEKTLDLDARILKEAVSQIVAYALFMDVRVIGIKEAREALKDLIIDPNYQFDELELALERGEDLIKFSKRCDKSFKYYIDNDEKTLFRNKIETGEWQELLILMNDKEVYSEEDVTKRWIRIINVDENTLKELNSYKKVIEYSDKFVKEVISNSQESNDETKEDD